MVPKFHQQRKVVRGLPKKTVCWSCYCLCWQMINKLERKKTQKICYKTFCRNLGQRLHPKNQRFQVNGDQVKEIFWSNVMQSYYHWLQSLTSLLQGRKQEINRNSLPSFHFSNGGEELASMNPLAIHSKKQLFSLSWSKLATGWSYWEEQHIEVAQKVVFREDRKKWKLNWADHVPP